MYSRGRWLQVKYLAIVFWYRWKRGDLPFLQESQRWLRPGRNFSVGDTFIIVDEHLPKNLWPIG